MDFDPVKNNASLQRQFTVGKSELAALEMETADIRKQIKDTEAACEAVNKDIASIKNLNESRDREIALLQARNESLQKQITQYTEVIRPQLLNELKQIKDLVKAKEKKYRETIEKYEKIWEKYEASYNKWPRVAERNAMREKLRLVKIEYMKKDQEAKELRKQAEQVYESKVQRLEALKEKYLKKYAEEQQLSARRKQLEQEVAERKARVALKRAAHHQRLEEEMNRQKELQEQHKVESESVSVNPETSTATKTRINIPVFKMNFNTLVYEHRSFSQGSAIPRSAPTYAQKGHGLKLASQPTSSTTQLMETAPIPTSTGENVWAPKATHLTNSNMLEQFMSYKNVRDSSADYKKPQDSVLPEKKSVENPKSVKEVSNVIPSSPLSSGGSKKESILSTDNIAAKLKETIRPNSSVAEDVNTTQSPITKSSEVLNADSDSATSSKDEDMFSHHMSGQDTIKVIGIDKPEKDKNVHTVHLDSNRNMAQGKSSELADFNGNSSDLSQAGENDNLPLEDENCFDFNTEYGDEMYSLQSPPAFESVMSPAPAGLESPSSKDSEEAQGEVQDAEQPSAITGFDFFSAPNPKLSTNFFGGQPSTDKSGSENNKSTSKFSFLF